MAYKTNLGTNSTATFDGMMNSGFGIVTVMNAMIFDALDASVLKAKTAYDIISTYKDKNSTGYICTLDTLKIANVTQEGPSKTITGGRYSNPLIKFGKSARLEMQDALGNAQAIEALCGGIREFDHDRNDLLTGLHFGEDFIGPKMIIGDSFFIDRKSGEQVKVKIVFYQFLPDSIFNLTQDAEGDATVFDMNGDLLTTEIKLGNSAGTGSIEHGVFYSIVDPSLVNTPANYYTIDASGKITMASGYTAKLDGVDVTSTTTVPSTKGTAAKLVIYQGSGESAVEVASYILEA